MLRLSSSFQATAERVEALGALGDSPTREKGLIASLRKLAGREGEIDKLRRLSRPKLRRLGLTGSVDPYEKGLIRSSDTGRGHHWQGGRRVL